MTKVELATCAAILFAGAALALYGNAQVHRAALMRVAACQMLPDRKSWEDFGCQLAFREAQR